MKISKPEWLEPQEGVHPHYRQLMGQIHVDTSPGVALEHCLSHIKRGKLAKAPARDLFYHVAQSMVAHTWNRAECYWINRGLHGEVIAVYDRIKGE